MLLGQRNTHRQQDEGNAGDPIKPPAKAEKPCRTDAFVKKTETIANQAKSILLMQAT
ncbi:MAG: hypothetical protein MO852_17515 [Candidatus Devosia euplotis]|nr:hypothetical protein [Candidatus Devosia euplotis]